MRCIRNAFVVAFLATLFLALFGALAVPAEAGIREATVKVMNPTRDARGNVISVDYGTGTLNAIDERGDLIYGTSCGHAFRGNIGGKFEIEAFDGQTAVATLIDYDKDLDLSAFSVAYRAGLDVIPIGEEEPDPNGAFVLAGYSGGQQFGQVTATMDTSRDYSGTPEIVPGLQLDQVKLYRFVHRGAMGGGSSGGGVFWRGKQYGVISAGNDPRESITACAADLAKFARRAKQVCRNGSCRMAFFFPKNRRPSNGAGRGNPAAAPAGSNPQSARPPQPVPHPGKLPPPVDDSQPDSAPPAPEPPGLTADFFRSELARLEGNLKGHTSQEADRLGGIAIGGLSNAKDQIKADLQAGLGKLASDPNAVKRIEDGLAKLGIPDAAAIADKVIAGLPASPAAEPGLLSGLAGTLGFNALLGAPAGPPGMLLTAVLGVGGFLFTRAMKSHTNQITSAIQLQRYAPAGLPDLSGLASQLAQQLAGLLARDDIVKRNRPPDSGSAPASHRSPPPPPAASEAECPAPAKPATELPSPSPSPIIVHDQPQQVTKFIRVPVEDDLSKYLNQQLDNEASMNPALAPLIERARYNAQFAHESAHMDLSAAAGGASQ